MRVRRAAIRAYRLPLIRPLETAHGPIADRAGWIVRLEDDAGLVGLGEACPLPEFGTEGPEECERALLRGIRALDGNVELASEPDDVLSLHAFWLGEPYRTTPCARAALESAWVDLASKQNNESLSDWLGRARDGSAAPRKCVEVQALVSGLSPDEVALAARGAQARGHRVFKLKLAVTPERSTLDFDLDRVAALRDVVGVGARIRLDANEAWRFEEAEQALARLAGAGIEYIEQPVARGDLEGMARLRRDGAIDVAADESLLGEGLAACLEREAAGILIAKPAALGGIRAARALEREAESRGLRLVWSTLLDGAVSRAGVLALAAAGPNPEEVHGLATGSLLADDFPGEAAIDAGSIAVPSGAGLGIRVDTEVSGAPWLGPPHEFELRR